jgi:hypothetical protein
MTLKSDYLLALEKKPTIVPLAPLPGPGALPVSARKGGEIKG